MRGIPRASSPSALGETPCWPPSTVKVALAGGRPGSWVRYSADRAFGLRGDVKPSKELSPLPRLDEPFPVMGCDYLSSFETLNSPREMKLLKKITLYSGSLGSGVDEERS